MATGQRAWCSTASLTGPSRSSVPAVRPRAPTRPGARAPRLRRAPISAPGHGFGDGRDFGIPDRPRGHRSVEQCRRGLVPTLQGRVLPTVQHEQRQAVRSGGLEGEAQCSGGARGPVGTDHACLLVGSDCSRTVTTGACAYCARCTLASRRARGSRGSGPVLRPPPSALSMTRLRVPVRRPTRRPRCSAGWRSACSRTLQPRDQPIGAGPQPPLLTGSWCARTQAGRDRVQQV